MSLTIDSPDTNKLLRELIATTGESESDAVTRALRERLLREQEKRVQPRSLADRLLRIGRECAALPVLDDRSAEEILGYNNNGMPT